MASERVGRVIKAYQRQYEAPIMLKAGEQVQITRQDRWDDQHRWLWCISEAGKEGWVHESFIETEGEQGIARLDYDALELTVSEGETLTLLDDAGGWYWAQNAAGERGWVPAANVAVDEEK
jgi:hypothetical protein